MSKALVVATAIASVLSIAVVTMFLMRPATARHDFEALKGERYITEKLLVLDSRGISG